MGYIQRVRLITALQKVIADGSDEIIGSSRSDRYKSLSSEGVKRLSDQELLRELTIWSNQVYDFSARRKYGMLKQNKLRRDGVVLNKELKSRGYKDLVELQDKVKNITAATKGVKTDIFEAMAGNVYYFFHGTSASLGRKIEQVGYLKPPTDTGEQHRWGEQPSQDSAVYVIADEYGAKDYGELVAQQKNETEYAVIKVKVTKKDIKKILPDEDQVYSILENPNEYGKEITDYVFEALRRAFDREEDYPCKSIEDAKQVLQEIERSDETGSLIANAMKDTATELTNLMKPDNLFVFFKEGTIAFETPLKVISVKYFPTTRKGG